MVSGAKVGAMTRVRAIRPLKALFAGAVACAVLTGCGGQKQVTVDELRDQASARVQESGAEGVAHIELDNLSGGITLKKGNDLTYYAAIVGGGGVSPILDQHLGVKRVEDLPLQKLADAQASAKGECSALGADYGFAEVRVAPTGVLLLTRACPGGGAGPQQVLDQSLDGQVVSDLGDVDSAQAIAQVMDEYTRTQAAGQISVINIKYGPGVGTDVAPEITILGDLVDVSGSTCRGGVAHSHLMLDGQGVELTCKDPASIDAEDPFELSQVSAEQLAALLVTVYQEIPRDSIRHVDVRKDADGIKVVVTAKNANGTWNLDGSRR